MLRPLPARFAAAAALLIPAAAFAGGYGDVTGRIVLDGDAPDLAPRVEKGASVKDAETCAAEPVPNFGLVVGEDGGVANVFLYPLRTPRDIKPELKEVPEQAVVFDQEGCVFKPHAVIVRAGQPMKLYNSDPVAHNVRFTSFGNPGINVTVPANATPDDADAGVEVTFKRGQKVPIPALCDFHPWMKANWLVVDHPYAAVTDETGAFTIEGLPEGKHSFTVWHESAGFLDRAFAFEVKDGEVTELDPKKYALSKFKSLK